MRGHIVVVVAGVMLGGCGVKSIDPCASVSGACVGLHLDGSATVTQLDGAIIHVTGGGVDAVKSTKSPSGTSFNLPIAVALSFASRFAQPTALRITVDGTRGGNTIAGGTATVTISGAAHVSAHVTMNAGALSLGGDLALRDGGGGDMALCGTGEHACGGACVNDTSIAACGTTCTACPTDPNATASCTNGACALTCNDHFVASGQTCIACGTENAACCAGNTCDAPFACTGTTTMTCQQKSLTWSATSDVNGLYTASSVAFTGVWVAGDGTIYVVGSGTGTSNQTIIASSDNGKTWSTETSADTSSDVIKAVTGTSDTAYALGDHGEIIATSNGTWNKVGCNIGADSNDVYGGVVSSGSLYLWDAMNAVQIVTLSNFTCSSELATGLMVVYGAWGDSTDLYAVGYAPGIIQTPAIKHSTDGGNSFGTDMQPAAGGYYSALWATATGQLYAATSKGLIAHTAAGGSTWTAENTSDAAGNLLEGVWSSDSGGYLYAVGGSGIVLQSDGDGTWHGQTSNTAQSLSAVSGNAAGTLVIAVGDHATIVIGQ